MAQWISILFAFFGSIFMLLAAIGILKFPDLPTRMHSSTKAGVLGGALIMIGVCVAHPQSAVLLRALAIVLFIFITAPIAAHVLGRAGYFSGVPLCDETIKDELRARYDAESHQLQADDETDDEIWEKKHAQTENS